MTQHIPISNRVTTIQEPIIPYIAQLIKDNPGTINFGQGIVDYLPPKDIEHAISAFLADPLNHRYKAVDGLPELQTAIYKKLHRENSIDINLPWGLFVTAGSNMAFLQAILAIADPADEIIILSPYYFNHEMAIRLANATPVIVATDAQHQPDINKIAQAITTKTRAIVTISPNNPTGAVYPKETLVAINELCAQHHIYHINDEAYEYFVYDGAQHYSPAAHAGAHQHTISLFSFSKTYAMASWRVGYVLLPQHLVTAMRKIQDTNLICAPVISQFAALAAINKGRDYYHAHIKTLAENRGLILQWLNAPNNLISYTEPKGAFYILMTVNSEFKAIDIARYLIEKHAVAVIPGETFGAADRPCLRIAYGALDRESIHIGIKQLVSGLKELAKLTTLSS